MSEQEIDLSGSEDADRQPNHSVMHAQKNNTMNNPHGIINGLRRSEESKESSYDDMSDGVGSDVEIAPIASIHKVNNEQAQKSAFA